MHESRRCEKWWLMDALNSTAFASDLLICPPRQEIKSPYAIPPIATVSPARRSYFQMHIF